MSNKKIDLDILDNATKKAKLKEKENNQINNDIKKITLRLSKSWIERIKTNNKNLDTTNYIRLAIIEKLEKDNL